MACGLSKASLSTLLYLLRDYLAAEKLVNHAEDGQGNLLSLFHIYVVENAAGSYNFWNKIVIHAEAF